MNHYTLFILQIVEKKNKQLEVKEPTYRTEPLQNLNSTLITSTVKELVDAKMSAIKRYSPMLCKVTSQALAEEIKRHVRDMDSDSCRYKIVSLVSIGELSDQHSMQQASKCLWNESLDIQITYTYTHNNIYCVATLYAIYTD